MRLLIGMIFLGIVTLLISDIERSKGIIAKHDPIARKVIAHCAKVRNNADQDYLRYVVSETRRLLRIAKKNDKNLEDLDESYATEILLAMFYTESRFVQSAVGDDKKSFGISQIQLKYEKEFRDYWKGKNASGMDASIDDPTVQVGLGVGYFVQCWHWADSEKGDTVRIWYAIKKYNGTGPSAVSHANKVMRFHRKIFNVD